MGSSDLHCSLGMERLESYSLLCVLSLLIFEVSLAGKAEFPSVPGLGDITGLLPLSYEPHLWTLVRGQWKMGSYK